MTLKTLQNTVLTSTVYQVPLFEELGDPQEEIQLIECQFHGIFDGIIGNDILRRYRAIINFRNNTLIINNKKVPLLYGETPSKHINMSEQNNSIIDLTHEFRGKNRNI